MSCRTVVLGAGLAGSLAALVCERAGHEILLVERDPVAVEVRPGAPHGQQLHNLLGRAQRHLKELVPGFEQAFLAAGGQRARVSSQTHVFELGTEMPERDLGLEIWSSRKSLVDQVVRRAVENAHIRQVFGQRAEGLEVSSGRVVGVRLNGKIINADVVVDAMGAKSPISRWLGSETLDVDEQIVRQWYSTMPVRRPASLVDRADFWLIFPTYPRTRGGMVSPVDQLTWNVSLSGGPGDEPPRTVDEFLAYAKTLEHPAVAELLAAGNAAEPPQTFRKPLATWRRFERAPHLPGGLLSVGDAVADLNPLYGQGISVATWQLSGLAALLTDGDDIDDLTASFRSMAAAVVGAAWNLATLYEVDAGDVTLSDADCQQIVDLVARDPNVHHRYVEVWHLLRPATELHDMTVAPAPASSEGTSV
jgi:flavin-dependent dehydrogenase